MSLLQLRRAVVAGIALTLAACAGPELKTEGGHDPLLAQARSYRLLPPDDFTEQQLLKDADLRGRLDAMIRQQLAARGLREQGDGGTADLLVRYVLNVNNAVISPIAIGQPRSTGIGADPQLAPELVSADFLPDDVRAREVREAVLAVDVLSPDRSRLLWRATLNEVLGKDREKNLAQTREALTRAFRELPDFGRKP